MANQSTLSADKSQRERFEKWAVSAGFSIAVMPGTAVMHNIKQYRSHETRTAQYAWNYAWQAAFEAGRRERDESRFDHAEQIRNFLLNPITGAFVCLPVETFATVEAAWVENNLTMKIAEILKPEAGDKRGAGEDGNG